MISNKISTILVLFLLVSFSVEVFSQTDKKADQLKTQQKEIEKKLARTKSLLKETSTKTKMSLNDLSLLKNQIENRKTLINSYSNEIVNIEGQIGQMSNDVDRLNRDLVHLKKEYAQIIYQSYKSRGSYNQWMFIFASKDFYQAMKRIRYLIDYSRYRKQKANDIVHTTIKINKNLENLGVRKKSKEELLTVKEKEAQELEKDKKTKEVTIKKLKGQEKELRNEIAKQQREWQSLNTKINQIIAEEIAKQKKKAQEEAERQRQIAEKNKANDVKNPNPNEKNPEKPATTTATTTTTTAPKVKIEASPADVKLSNDFILNQGKLPWPSEKASIVSHFGKHADEDLPEIIRDNRGVDFLCEQGDAARAVFSGKVTRIISMPAGYAVLIQHGTYYTVYTYLSSVSVREGQTVETKQKLGTIAVDPLKKETVLHFELWKGQTIQNPEVWLRR